MIIIYMAAALILINACAAMQPKQKSPEWVRKGSGALDVDEGKVFYGIGAASDIQKQIFLKVTTENRARSEMAKIIETYVALLYKNYMLSTMANDLSTTAEELHVGRDLKSISRATRQHATIVDYWMDSTNGTLYALCKLDLAAFKAAIDDLHELDPKLREYSRNNAEKIHAELAKMENQAF